MTTYKSLTSYYGSREFIGAVLRHARTSQGITIRALADTCGFNKSTIVNLEKGAYTPRIDVVQTLANALGISICIGSLDNDIKQLLNEVEKEIKHFTGNLDAYHNTPKVNAIKRAIGEISTYVLLMYAAHYDPIAQ